MINPLDLYFRSLIQTIDIVVKLPSDATSVEEPLVEKSIQKMTDSRFLVIQQFCTNFAIACPVNPTKVLHCLYVDIGGRSLKVSSLTKYTFLLIVRIPQTCDKLMITTKHNTSLSDNKFALNRQVRFCNSITLYLVYLKIN